MLGPDLHGLHGPWLMGLCRLSCLGLSKLQTNRCFEIPEYHDPDRCLLFPMQAFELDLKINPMLSTQLVGSDNVLYDPNMIVIPIELFTWPSLQMSLDKTNQNNLKKKHIIT